MTKQLPTPPKDKKVNIIMLVLAIYCAIIFIGVAFLIAHAVRQWGR